jgi:sodium-dependent dicarboxylate transporter 2/3/5
MTSNTATTQVMLPILGKASQAFGVHPLLLMLPATASASCAFMLPVATPPNAIVFGSGKVNMGHMVRTGIVLNLVGVVLVTLVIYLVAKPLLGIRLDTLPAWAG